MPTRNMSCFKYLLLVYILFVSSLPWTINQQVTGKPEKIDSITTTTTITTTESTSTLSPSESKIEQVIVNNNSSNNNNINDGDDDNSVKPPKLPKPINFPVDHLFLPDSLRDWGEPFDSIFNLIKRFILIADSLLFPESLQRVSEPLQSIRNFLVRIPVSIIAWIIGENVELLGHQVLQIGNAFLAFGSKGFGLTFKDYGIGFMAFGKTVKDWFVYQQIPQRLIEITKNRTSQDEPAYGLWWNELGISYIENRVALQQLYSNQS